MLDWEHSIIAGLAREVAKTLASEYPILMEVIGVKDTITQTIPDIKTFLVAGG